MADAMEPIRQHMAQETANKLCCIETHDLLLIAVFDPIIFPAKRHCLGVGADQTTARDGDAVGVPAEHLRTPAGTYMGLKEADVVNALLGGCAVGLLRRWVEMVQQREDGAERFTKRKYLLDEISDDDPDLQSGRTYLDRRRRIRGHAILNMRLY